MQLDICLSLFYQPYFIEFYEYVKLKKDTITANKKKFIIKNMLEYLADDMQFQIIVERDMIDKSVREYYIQKDIHKKSKELIELLT